MASTSRQCISSLSLPLPLSLSRMPMLRQKTQTSRITSHPWRRHQHQHQRHQPHQLHQQHYYHSSGVVKIIDRIQSFRNTKDDSLHFIISSSSQGTEGKGEREGTKIFSPALFLADNDIDTDTDADIDTDLTKDPSSATVQDDIIRDISAIVESHYTLDGSDGRDQFVGGMGENDGGVWFVADCSDGSGCDTLDHWQLIRGKE